MKYSLPKIAGALVLALAISSAAQAVPINGSVGFGGGFSTDSDSDFTLATGITSFSGDYTLGVATGDYAPVSGILDPTSFTPFSFAASSVTPLWSFVFAGITYSFDATSMSVILATNYFIAQGNGIAHITGFDATPGTWIISGNSGGANLTFSASTAVPDGGMTAVLVGLGLVGMSFFANRQQRKLTLAN